MSRSGSGASGLDHLELRMDDLAAEVAVAHFAEHADAAPGRERLLLIRIEVEEAQHQLRARIGVAAAALAIRAAVFEQADELAPRPVLDVGGDDGAFGLLLGTRLQRRERHDPRVVLVAQRQVQHQVLVADEPEPHELVVQPAPAGLRVSGRGLRRRNEIGGRRLRTRGAAGSLRGREAFGTGRIGVTGAPIIAQQREAPGSSFGEPTPAATPIGASKGSSDSTARRSVLSGSDGSVSAGPPACVPAPIVSSFASFASAATSAATSRVPSSSGSSRRCRSSSATGSWRRLVTVPLRRACSRASGLAHGRADGVGVSRGANSRSSTARAANPCSSLPLSAFTPSSGIEAPAAVPASR